eukprot:251196_1
MKLPGGYPDDASVYINAMIVYSLLMSVDCILFCATVRTNHAVENKSSNSIKITVTLALLASAASSASWLILMISCFVMSRAASYNHNLVILFKLSFTIGGIFQVLSFILRGHFVKAKLEDTFKHNFFAVNKTFINLCLMIYLLSVVFSRSIWIIDICTEHDVSLVHYISRIQFIIATVIYYLIILILFNKKLHQFLTLTTNNDITLSS